MFDIRLMLYDIDEPVGVIPQAQGIQAAFPLNDSPTLQFTIPTDLPDSISYEDILKWIDDYDVALQWSDEQGIWKEEPSCRFVFKNDSSNLTQKNDQYSLTAIGVDWDLTGMVNLKTSTLNSEGKHVFENATPGAIVKWMIDTAQAEDLGTAIKYDFTATKDSAGNAWPNKLTMSVAPEVNVHQVLESLQSQGQLDWRFNGFTLQLYVADTAMRRDRDMEFIIGREVDSAPQKRDRSDIANKVLVVGDEGRYLVRSLPTNRRRGSRAIVQTQSGVKDTGTMTVLADATLKEHSEDSEELTREYVCTPAMVTTPLKDFLPGDRIYANGASGSIELLRVAQITVEKTVGEDGNVKGNILLQDRYLEDLLKQKRRIDGITNGTAVGGGTGGTPTPPPNEDKTKYKPVTNVTTSSSAYIDGAGEKQSLVALDFPPVTEDLQGKPVDQTMYFVAYILKTGPRASSVKYQAGYFDSIPITVPNLEPGQTYDFLIQAGMGHRFSVPTTVEVTTAVDTAPPQKPSAPILSTKSGIVRAEWDGQDFNGGTSWPLDTVGVNVYANDVLRAVLDTRIPSAPLGEYLVGSVVNVYFKALDAWGNESDPSDTKSINVASVLDSVDREELTGFVEDTVASSAGKSQVYWSHDEPTGDAFTVGSVWFRYSANEATDVIGMYSWDGQAWHESSGFRHEAIASIDLGKATVGELDGGRIRANSVTSDKIVVDDLLAHNVLTHAVVADYIDAGSVTSAMITSDTITGKSFSGTTVTGGLIQTDAAANRGIKLQSDLSTNTLRAWDTTGRLIADIDSDAGTVTFGDKFNLAADGSLTMTGELYTAGSNKGRIHLHSAPTGAAYDSAIDFLTTDNSYNTPVIQSGYDPYDTSGNISHNALYIRSGRATASTSFGAWAASNRYGVHVGYYGGLGSQAFKTWSEMTFSARDVTIWTDHNDSGSVHAYGYSFSYQPWKGSALFWRFGEPNCEMRFVNSVNAGSSVSAMPHISGNANMAMANDGTVSIISSMSEYKLDQKPWDELDDTILDVQPKTWIDKHEYEYKHNDPEGADAVLSRIPGLIVEDLEKLNVPEAFFTHDGNGERSGLAYDRMWLALIPIIKKLKTSVDGLEERIENGNAA